MLDLSPTTARLLKLGTATFIVAVAAAVVFSRPDAGAAQKPAVEAQTTIGSNDRTIVTVSSSSARNAVAKR